MIPVNVKIAALGERRFSLYRFCRRAVVLMFLLMCASASAAAEPVRVAAASSLRLPLDIALARFAADTGIDCVISYGASGNLTHQILRGAPFDLFLSADQGYPARLQQAGLVRRGPVEYARGRLVLYVPRGSPLFPATGLNALVEALTAGRVARMAIANPALAPYGRAARQALEAVVSWDLVEPVLVRGNSVSQAASFAFSGNVDAALISESTVIVDGVSDLGRFEVIPSDLYDPVIHEMVLLDRGGDAAGELFDYLLSDRVGAILTKYGFDREVR